MCPRAVSPEQQHKYLAGLPIPGAQSWEAVARQGMAEHSPPASVQPLTVTYSPSLGFRLILEAWHLRQRSSTSSTGTCTCSVVVLFSVDLVHAGARTVCSHLHPIPSCSPSIPVFLPLFSCASCGGGKQGSCCSFSACSWRGPGMWLSPVWGGIA